MTPVTTLLPVDVPTSSCRSRADAWSELVSRLATDVNVRSRSASHSSQGLGQRSAQAPGREAAVLGGPNSPAPVTPCDRCTATDDAWPRSQMTDSAEIRLLSVDPGQAGAIVRIITQFFCPFDRW
jgi:hypothetical protein